MPRLMEPVDAAARQLSVLEPLELRHLPQEGLAFDEALPAAWLAGVLGPTSVTGEVLQIMGPGRAQLTVTPLGPGGSRPPILVRGELRAAARTPCVRRLADVDLTLADSMETTLFAATPAPEEVHAPRGKGAGRGRPEPQPLEDWSGEALPELEALAEGTYAHERVDLPSLLEEALLLALDMNPTGPDEPGCDARTQALLEEANRPARAVEAQPDPRWASLHELMERGPEED